MQFNGIQYSRFNKKNKAKLFIILSKPNSPIATFNFNTLGSYTTITTEEYCHSSSGLNLKCNENELFKG